MIGGSRTPIVALAVLGAALLYVLGFLALRSDGEEDQTTSATVTAPTLGTASAGPTDVEPGGGLAEAQAPGSPVRDRGDGEPSLPVPEPDVEPVTDSDPIERAEASASPPSEATTSTTAPNSTTTTPSTTTTTIPSTSLTPSTTTPSTTRIPSTSLTPSTSTVVAVRGSGTGAPLQLVPPPTPNSRVGESVSVFFPISGGSTSVVTYGAEGLPPGLAVDAASGEVSGRPTEAGVYSVSLSVSQSNATFAQDFTWVVS